MKKMEIIENGSLKAQVVTGKDEFPRGFHRYTGYIKYSGDRGIEEIDVNAVNEFYAKKMIHAELKANYEANGKLIRIQHQIGFYF
jgi:hypothetical protein